MYLMRKHGEIRNIPQSHIRVSWVLNNHPIVAQRARENENRVEIVLRILRRRILKIDNLIRPYSCVRGRNLFHHSISIADRYISTSITFILNLHSRSCNRYYISNIALKFIGKNIFHTKISKSWMAIKTGIILVNPILQYVMKHVWYASIIEFLLPYLNNFHIYNIEISIWNFTVDLWITQRNNHFRQLRPLNSTEMITKGSNLRKSLWMDLSVQWYFLRKHIYFNLFLRDSISTNNKTSWLTQFEWN